MAFGPFRPVVRTSSFHVEDTGSIPVRDRYSFPAGGIIAERSLAIWLEKVVRLPLSQQARQRSPLLSVMDFLEFFLSLRCPFIDSRTSDRKNLHACVLSLLPQPHISFLPPLFCFWPFC